MCDFFRRFCLSLVVGNFVAVVTVVVGSCCPTVAAVVDWERLGQVNHLVIVDCPVCAGGVGVGSCVIADGGLCNVGSVL